MKLSFNVPDQVYEKYVVKFGVSGAYQRMRKVLEEMQDVDPSDRYILVAGDDRRAIEKIFQTTIETASGLAKKVARLNAVNIEGARMDFTSDELERIRDQASFHGRTFEAFLIEMLSEMKDRMLNLV